MCRRERRADGWARGSLARQHRGKSPYCCHVILGGGADVAIHGAVPRRADCTLCDGAWCGFFHAGSHMTGCCLCNVRIRAGRLPHIMHNNTQHMVNYVINYISCAADSDDTMDTEFARRSCFNQTKNTCLACSSPALTFDDRGSNCLARPYADASCTFHTGYNNYTYISPNWLGILKGNIGRANPQHPPLITHTISSLGRT